MSVFIDKKFPNGTVAVELFNPEPEELQMDVLAACNPQLIADDALARYERMDQKEFFDELQTTLESAKKMLGQDDSRYSASLTENEAVEYANFVRTLRDRVNDLESVEKLAKLGSKMDKHTAAPYLAQVIAWRQVLSAFKTLHGG